MIGGQPAADQQAKNFRSQSRLGDSCSIYTNQPVSRQVGYDFMTRGWLLHQFFIHIVTKSFILQVRLLSFLEKKRMAVVFFRQNIYFVFFMINESDYDIHFVSFNYVVVYIYLLYLR